MLFISFFVGGLLNTLLKCGPANYITNKCHQPFLFDLGICTRSYMEVNNTKEGIWKSCRMLQPLSQLTELQRLYMKALPL